MLWSGLLNCSRQSGQRPPCEVLQSAFKYVIMDNAVHKCLISVNISFNLVIYMANGLLCLVQIVQDVRYFQRIKWQYLVLDEAQAIKSSARWEILANGNWMLNVKLWSCCFSSNVLHYWSLKICLI